MNQRQLDTQARLQSIQTFLDELPVTKLSPAELREHYEDDVRWLLAHYRDVQRHWFMDHERLEEARAAAGDLQQMLGKPDYNYAG